LPQQAESRRFPSRALWWLGLLVLAALVLAGTFDLTRRAALAELRQSQETEMRARVQALESVLLRQRAVATVLADDAVMLQALRDPSALNRERVSLKLDRLRNQTDSAVIYLLDSQGVAIAASNWDEATSFIGENYSFRDYFSEALLKGEATQFAMGTVSHRPGLYLSHDLRETPVLAEGQGAALGVIVVKVEFDPLERNWRSAHARTEVQDALGQVILSSDPALRFQPAPVPGAAEIVTEAAVPGTDWVLRVTGSTRPALVAGLMATGTAGFGLTLLGIGAGFALRARRRAARKAEAERRYRIDLQRAVDDRTRALSDEMRERRALEKRLDRLRAEMVQANKLAALGQITAGVAHEVNQPLATIRLLAENGEALLAAGETLDVAGNLGSIRRMADRIARITDQLRGFARKANGQVGPVALRDAFEVALLLTAAPREAQGIALDRPDIPPDLRVRAETVALEQILVNLLQNAQEALAGTPEPRITVSIQPGAPLRITVSDNGPGLTPEMYEQLFTPFLTSKPRGMGLGLVISQDLARSFGGNLHALPPQPGQGATFVLELPSAE